MRLSCPFLVILCCVALYCPQSTADAEEAKLRKVTVYEESVPGFSDLIAVGNLDAQNRRQGEWSWYWKYYHQRLARTGHYLDDKRDLEWTYRDTAGHVIKRGEFKDNREVGCWRRFQSSGQEAGFTKYWESGGHRWELSTEYYDTGAVQSTTIMRDGVPHGCCNSYYANGQICLSRSYKFGNQDGPFEWRREDGSFEITASYKGGHAEGTWTEFHANGKIREIGELSKGKKIGTWKKYDQDGTLTESAQWDD